jgi:hypothetical protein
VDVCARALFSFLFGRVWREGKEAATMVVKEGSSSSSSTFEDVEREEAGMTTTSGLLASKSFPALGGPNNAPRRTSEIVRRATFLGAAPSLPGVDSRIGRDELKYSTMSDALRLEKWTEIEKKVDVGENNGKFVAKI